jgi:hypothetical protein
VNVIVKIAWDRLLTSFIEVDAVTLQQSNHCLSFTDN